MIIDSNNQGMNPEEVDKMIVSRVKKMIGIKATGDTPTDAKQLVNKQYVDSKISSITGVAPGSAGNIPFNVATSVFGSSSVFSYGQASIVGDFTVGGGSVYGRINTQDISLTALSSGGNAGEAHYRLADQGKMDIFTDSVTTTDASWVPLQVIPLVAGLTVNITARILAHRTGGSAGSAGDTSFYMANATFTRDGISAQIGTTTTLVSQESNVNTDFRFVLFGSQPRLEVMGDVNNNYTWDVLYTVFYIYP